METTPNSSGQRLRWWHEEAPQTQKWYSEPAPQPTQTVSPPAVIGTLSFDEELEAEALRRTALERDAVVIEGSYASTMPKVWRRLGWTLGPIALINLIEVITGHSWGNALIPLIFVAECFLIAVAMRRQFDQNPPQIVLSSLGMTLDTPNYRVGPVFWDEIKSVRVVNWGFYKYVSVKLKDPETCKRALAIKSGPTEWLTRLFFNKTQIDITDEWLPLSAQELAAKIATFDPSSVRDSD